uniref:PDZ domain-containing protein n=1 Tax=Meloidogyne floridensis TaxID=298350 RepID=A0A915NXI8_9BILA
MDILCCFAGLMLVGDKFLLINDKPATDAKQLNGLVTAFRHCAENSLPIKVKLERKIAVTEKVPNDVLQILERRNGFWYKPSPLNSISDVDESEYKVYHVKSVESVTIAFDDSGKKLKKIPSPSGSNSSLDGSKEKKKKQ